MESESEHRPLLRSFERETWRSSLRKRCLRIPSEVTITGIILGLFLMVVTLLIVFENLETTNKDEMKLGDTLLGSPMKYNKKALDTSWQDKKNSMKTRKKFKDQKWSKVNDGWKKIRDPSGMKSTLKNEGLNENSKEKVKIADLSIGNEEYGKELDDSLETLIKNEWSTVNAAKKFDTKKSELKYLLENSNMKWKKVDDGWKTLSEQGWKDEAIKKALLEVLKERDFSEEQDGVSQSPLNLDDICNKIKDNWKEKIDEGHEEPEKQVNMNHEWNNKMTENKWEKVDDGWKTLSNQGWKNGQIVEALLKVLKRKELSTKKENVLKSSSKLEDLWDKINDKWDELLYKEEKEKEKQKSTNGEWENQISVFNSPKSKLKKMKKEDLGWEKLIDQGWKNKDIEEAIIKAWKEKKDEDSLQSSMSLKPLWKETVDMLKTLIEKDSTKEASQRNINEEWVNKNNVLQSPKSIIKVNSDGDWKILIKKDWNNEEIKEALNKIKLVIENLQNERNNSRRTKPPRRSKGTTASYQSEIPLDKIDLENSNEELKMLSDQVWSDKDVEEALYEALKDGNKLMQSSMGYNSMKWKKVNDGYKKIFNKSVGVPIRCPISKSHLLGSSMSSPGVNCALIAEEARRKLGKCIDMSFMPKSCKPAWRSKCFSTYKYRKIDGTCNNEIHPTWGKSGTPFVRMMAPEYGDGVSTLRTAKNGEPLPNPRYLSTKLYSKRMKPDSDNSIIFLYFGLIVDHDMVETAINSDAIPCCEEEFQKNQQNRPKECLQIDVSNNDPFYGPRNVTCLNLVRSIPVTGECAGRREQLNKATSFLDASAVYGSNIKQAKQLRTFSRGQLRTQLINNTPFMSSAEGAGYSCGTPKEPLKCFEAGDSRVNMIVELTAMHTLWYREHNRIATKLHELNPKWTDETLYQEARKILIGELQHITYNEFLSLLLGEKTMKKYQLSTDTSKNYNGYDDTINPSVFNVFGAAAFRFGHSIVPDMQNLLGSKHSNLRKVPLHETFFNAEILYHEGLDMLLRGAALQRAQTVDSYITSEVREHLFQPANLDYGHDLAAVGIQRGRDHGLPSYTKWRSACGLSEVKTWKDLYKIMEKERADTFKSVYQSVEDIDLIPGALAEFHERGSLLGPTYTCLIGRQFKKTRKGDRFWYEIQNGVGSFTKGQLDQIYKSSMSRIICDNSDEIKTMQRNAFKVPSDHNPLLDCNAIPKIDLSEWSINN